MKAELDVESVTVKNIGLSLVGSGALEAMVTVGVFVAVTIVGSASPRRLATAAPASSVRIIVVLILNM